MEDKTCKCLAKMKKLADEINTEESMRILVKAHAKLVKLKVKLDKEN